MPAKREEAKPWQETNSDGSVNYGSYAFQAALGLVELAHDMLFTANLPLERDLVRALAATLITVADTAQSRIRVDQRHDRMDNSHTRARGALRSALDSVPPPWGQDEEAWDQWQQRLTNRTVALLRLAVEIDSNQYAKDPWKALAGIKPGGSTTGPENLADTGDAIPYAVAVEQVREMVAENFPEDQVESRVLVFTSMLQADDQGMIAGSALDEVIAQMDAFITEDKVVTDRRPTADEAPPE